MQTKFKNKAIGADDAQNKVEQPLIEFHFAGDGEYEPLTVKARDPEEAEKLWQEKRRKVVSLQEINK